MIFSILQNFVVSVIISMMLTLLVRKMNNRNWWPRSIWDLTSKGTLMILFAAAVILHFFSMNFIFACAVVLLAYFLLKDKIRLDRLFDFSPSKGDECCKNRKFRGMDD